jgi:hypothetical protein
MIAENFINLMTDNKLQIQEFLRRIRKINNKRQNQNRAGHSDCNHSFLEAEIEMTAF